MGSRSYCMGLASKGVGIRLSIGSTLYWGLQKLTILGGMEGVEGWKRCGVEGVEAFIVKP